MSHSNTLTIHDLTLWTRIGVPDEERSKEQRILAAVSIDVKSGAGEGDDLMSTVDYEKISKEIRALAREERKTLEKFAEDIARAVLNYPHATRVTVTMRKFILPGTKEVSLTIIRP
jgi:FolB domain-containing protein